MDHGSHQTVIFCVCNRPVCLRCDEQHYQLVIKINADEVNQWSDEEVAKRWMQIFSGPILMHQFLTNADLTEAELEYIEVSLGYYLK